MAILLLTDGTTRKDLSAIARELAPLNVTLKHYTARPSQIFPDPLLDLLPKDVLTEPEKQYILELHHYYADVFKQENDHLWCDLLTVHPGSPNLYTLTATHSPYHVHVDPESLYVLSGSAIFGFAYPDGNHVKLLVQQQDYLYIPAGVEHWFSPTASLNVKALRYFASVEGWVPQYTGTEAHDPRDRLRFS